MTSTAIAICPSCRVEVGVDDCYCEECGHQLGPDGAAAIVAPAGLADCCAACGEAPSGEPDGYCGVCGIRQPAPDDRREAVDRSVAAVTDRGRRRPRNEDAFAVATTAGGRVLAVVCDGVSTTMNSDQASTAAAGAALAALQRDADDQAGADALAEAFSAARHDVNGVEWSPLGQIGPPSCTFLAAIATGSTIELSSIGDCRAFWLPGRGELETLTRDDSWASEQVLTGAMSSEAAHADARSHCITRWLGHDADPSWEPQYIARSNLGPGRLVLCSDGLWNYAPGAADVANLAGPGDPLAVARRLVDHANQQGGLDNITVVVIDMPCCPHKPEPPQTKEVETS